MTSILALIGGGLTCFGGGHWGRAPFGMILEGAVPKMVVVSSLFDGFMKFKSTSSPIESV